MANLNATRRSVLAAAAAFPGGAWAAPATVVAATRNGRVRGARDRGALVFKGIRYGDAPRFQAPAPQQPWRGVRDALAYGSASPQRGEEPNQREDCLYLNVWTPALDRARRPVMVYIHGGAYATGSGSSPLYDGTALVRGHDVVVVTLNHRLNLFGYAYLARLGGAEFADSGNAGQLDLVLALTWVRDNIAAFGGDPGCVMLFGQSGGGAKIATLMGTPAAAGLFHRAATMSGQQVTASGPLNATLRTQAWLSALGAKDAQAVRTLPAAQLLEAAARAEDPILGGSLYFGPVLDDRTLFRHPFYPDAPPQSASIPMMLGNTHDETRAFFANDKRAFALTWDDLPVWLTQTNMRADIRPERVITEYRRLYPTYSPSDVFFAATTASRSWRGQVIEAEARARQGAPAYVYQVNWRSSFEGGRLGAPHMIDIPLAFNTAATPGSLAEGGTAASMADTVSAAFARFARSGDPNGPGLPSWTPYTLERRETMIFDMPPRMENDPRGPERRLFATVPYVQPGA
jgi:para-nitrobenzyl esterase